MAEDSTGFLGRWARRKTEVLQGKPVVETGVETGVEPADKVAGKAAVKPVSGPVVEPAVVAQSAPSGLAAQAGSSAGQEPAPEPPPLSLEDAKLLTKDSDFKPFMARGVGPDVRNAAMKKLFADPHFNVMDGLDIYIDDYSKSDPIPEAMLRAMTSSKFLKLFDEEEALEKPVGETPQTEHAKILQVQAVSQPCEPTDASELAATPHINPSQSELLPDGGNAVASQKDHDYPDLRLQPDHAAPAPEAGHGT